MFKKSENIFRITIFIKRKSEQMTRLGEYFERKSINKSEVARKTGLSKPRLTELTNTLTTKLRADELYLIALAIDVDPGELLEFVCQGLKLQQKDIGESEENK